MAGVPEDTKMQAKSPSQQMILFVVLGNEPALGEILRAPELSVAADNFLDVAYPWASGQPDQTQVTSSTVSFLVFTRERQHDQKYRYVI
jgi:hypothetical protein